MSIQFDQIGFYSQRTLSVLNYGLSPVCLDWIPQNTKVCCHLDVVKLLNPNQSNWMEAVPTVICSPIQKMVSNSRIQSKLETCRTNSDTCCECSLTLEFNVVKLDRSCIYSDTSPHTESVLNVKTNRQKVVSRD